MPELVRAGRILIAQPPLYQIKRKKREEYVDDDLALNRILIGLGADEVRLKNLADGHELTAAQLKDILDLLEKRVGFCAEHDYRCDACAGSSRCDGRGAVAHSAVPG